MEDETELTKTYLPPPDKTFPFQPANLYQSQR